MPRIRISPLLLAACLAASPALAASPLGCFDHNTDIGAVGHPGRTEYEPQGQTFTLTASGTNVWHQQDELHLVYRRVRGDFIIQGLVELLGAGVDPHRKTGFMVRKSLEPGSAHVSLCLHGDGLTSVQFRRSDGATTEEVRMPFTGGNVLEVSRRGGVYHFAAAVFGAPYTERELGDIDLGDEVYVGFYACSHNNTVTETATARNVRLIRPAPEGFTPYRDYIGSHLELLDPATGHRRIIHTVADSLQAPNWTPDNQALIYNHNGRIGRFDLKEGTARLIPTGDVIENNNDHALSFDGRFIGLSSGQPSRVYTVPIEGGQPKLITPTGPSYLHGWSPDGKTLVFTGGRNGNYDIYSVPSQGGPETRLTTSPALDDGSEFTPDGKQVLFISNRTGTMQIWRMNPDGSGQTQVTHDTFNNWFPHPSPDGKSILFLSYRPEVPSGDHPFYQRVYLRQMPLAGGEPRVVAYFYGGQGSINVNSWSPDSGLVAFVSNSAEFVSKK